MVIAGTINRVAFYCRVNHRDRDYEKYLDDVMRRLEEEYGKQKWDLQIFFEEASGADPNRKEFNRLKAEIAAKKIDVVVTMRAATIARNWGQFMEFMLICSKTEAGRLLITFTRTLHHFLQKTFSGTPESFGKWLVHPLPCQCTPHPHFSYCKSA